MKNPAERNQKAEHNSLTFKTSTEKSAITQVQETVSNDAGNLLDNSPAFCNTGKRQWRIKRMDIGAFYTLTHGNIIVDGASPKIEVRIATLGKYNSRIAVI